MFDDPKKELKRLDAELLALAEEEPEEEWDCPEEEDDLTPGRNPAVDFSRMAYADEYLEEAQVLTKGKRRRKAHRKTRQKTDGTAEQQKKPRKKKRGVIRQLIFGILEIILIILVVRWWLQWNS